MSKATPKQIAFIKKLSGELGNDREYNFTTMTKSQASQIIEELLGQKEDQDIAYDEMREASTGFDRSDWDD